MKLARVGPPDADIPVTLLGAGRPADLAGVIDDIDPILAGDGLDRVRAQVPVGAA